MAQRPNIDDKPRDTMRLVRASNSRRQLCMAEPPELEGAAGAWLRFVRRAKSYVEIFPPVGIGLGCGLGFFGCGLGWNIRRLSGPPHAFCGCGVACGVGVGYGSGIIGKRFGRDNRSPETLTRIKTLENTLENVFKEIRARLPFPKPVPVPDVAQTVPTPALANRPHIHTVAARSLGYVPFVARNSLKYSRR